MVETLKDTLKKTGKALRVIGSPRNHYWPAGVLNQLEVQYHLRPEDMLHLGYLTGKSDRRNKNYVLYIYDKIAASDKNIPVKNVHDIYHSSDLLRFAGRMTVDGSIHLEKVTRFN